MTYFPKVQFSDLRRYPTLENENDPDKIKASLSEIFKVPCDKIEVDAEKRISIISYT
jgi:hypothetical protein